MKIHYAYPDGKILCNSELDESDEIIIAPSTIDIYKHKPGICGSCYFVLLSILAEKDESEL